MRSPFSPASQPCNLRGRTLRSPSLRERLRRSTANWTSYAAATSSAFAMLTNVSASVVGTDIRDRAPEPAENVVTGKQHFGTSQNEPRNRAVVLAMARQDSEEGLFLASNFKTAQTSQSLAPSIDPGARSPAKQGTQELKTATIASSCATRFVLHFH
jgi:hypothetical protein